MGENTIICCQCGAELPIGQTICTKCGCPAIKKHTVTFRKDKNSYLASALFVINIFNDKDSAKVAVDGKTEQQVELLPGEYKVELLCGLLTLNHQIILCKDVTFEVGAKAGFWANKLFINET